MDYIFPLKHFVTEGIITRMFKYWALIQDTMKLCLQIAAKIRLGLKTALKYDNFQQNENRKGIFGLGTAGKFSTMKVNPLRISLRAKKFWLIQYLQLNFVFQPDPIC